MKQLLSSLIAIIFSCSNSEKNPSNYGTSLKTTIIFFNTDKEYSVGINKQMFWSERSEHDTILIVSKRLNKILDERFDILKDTVLWGGKDDLRYAVAFIRETNRGKKDTLYTSPAFRYWKRGNKDYVENTGLFKSMFGKFLIFENQ